jgi:hypothetical protein
VSLDRQLLIDIGEALYGPEWRRKLARALGPLHPKGARETIDIRLPARWAVGERAIPAWVGPALRRLINEREASLMALAQRVGIDKGDE